MESENKEKNEALKEAKIEAQVEKAEIEAKLAEAKVEAKLEEAKIEAKLDEAKIEAKAEEKKCAAGKCCSKKFCCKKIFKNKTYVAVTILVILVLASAVYKYLPKKTDIGPVAAKAKITKFINDNLLQPGTTATVSDLTLDGDLYKMTVNVGKQQVTAYLTKDGSKFFPQVINVDQAPAKTDNSDAQATPEKTTADAKTDVPDVKLFVMSYCPYGTQMEKGILPVLQALGSKIKFSLEFVNYSMHNSKAQNDRKELDENLRQYCIEKNQPTQLNSYLTCFLKQGKGTEASCMTQAGVDATQVSTCVKAADTQFNVTKDFNDESSYQGSFPQFEVNKDDNTKYGVQGSPTLVINGTQVSPAGRDSESILKAICSGFNNQPAECQKALSATSPAPGFGEGTAAASGAAASCATN